MPLNLRSAALALTMTAGFTATAMADDTVPTEHVRIDQYNLNTEDGRRAVLRHLSFAAKHVCAVGESRLLEDVARAEACYRDSLANAVQAVRSERLTELYMARAKGGSG